MQPYTLRTVVALSDNLPYSFFVFARVISTRSLVNFLSLYLSNIEVPSLSAGRVVLSATSLDKALRRHTASKASSQLRLYRLNMSSSVDPMRRNKRPRLLSNEEKQKLDEFTECIHYSARYETALINHTSTLTQYVLQIQ